MKIYCSHEWVDTQKLIVTSHVGGSGDTAFGSISNEYIPVRICDLCHAEWLKGDVIPEVEIGHTKE